MSVLFGFQIQSKSDIITNSSSELFVYSDKNETLEEFKELLDIVYPDWREEYREPVFLKDLDRDDLETYIEYVEQLDYYYFNYPNFLEDKNSGKLKESEIAKELGLTEEEAYDNWEKWYPNYLRENKEAKLCDHLLEYRLYISDLFYKKYREKYGDNITLWSWGENPNWNYQGKLMTIASRYHLG